MHRRGHESTIRAEVVNPTANFIMHLGGRAIGEHTLRIHQPAPEGNLIAKVALEALRFHARRADLDWINGVNADLDQVRDDFPDCPATVEEDLGVGAGFDEIADLL